MKRQIKDMNANDKKLCINTIWSRLFTISPALARLQRRRILDPSWTAPQPKWVRDHIRDTWTNNPIGVRYRYDDEHKECVLEGG